MTHPIQNSLLRRLWRMKLLVPMRLRHARGFRFEGVRHRFLFAPYNCTWLNERQVEVPVVRRLLRGSDPKHTLEVGNVLSHYGRVRHRVVDKYERARGVTNEDFLGHGPDAPYALIVSISTFEHVGWDEPGRDARGFLRAVAHAQRLLAPGGLLAFTVPLGYNPEVDRFAAGPPPGFRIAFLERAGPGPGRYRQAARASGATHPYHPSGHATGVAVVTWRAPPGGGITPQTS